MTDDVPAVALDHVSLAFDEQVVLRDISFVVPTGHTHVILGASGSGKSLILKLILGLIRPDSGSVAIDGTRIDRLSEDELMRIRTRIGMLFQESALFDSLTVAENVAYGLVEHSGLTPSAIRRRVEEVLGLIGLGSYIDARPAELSGGQRRRVAIARAMAGRPPLLLFDEPTSGLDPITATTVDDEIVKSRDLSHATSIIVTHQVRDALYVATHSATMVDKAVRIVATPDTTAAAFMMLRDGSIYFTGSADDLLMTPDPYIRAFVGTQHPAWLRALTERARQPG